MAKRTCDVPECGRPHLAKGLCGKHYQRLRSTGSTEQMPQRLCSVNGCDRKHHGHGCCNTHHARLLATGSLGTPLRERKRCTFDDCGRPAVSRGLCGSHANQQKRGGPLTPLRSRQKTTVRDEQGRKRCSSCRSWQDPSKFYPVSKTADGLSTYCKRCDRDMRLSRSYGISVAQYEELLALQGGGCAICGSAPKDSPSLHVDHDHACCPDRKKSCGRCLRGLLCEDCNRALGMFRDDVARFEAAIAYLKRGRL
ncbi:endonuclease VII domain-containing protein [Streptomyces sp. 1222.5]|uniref:endonuclease VII domain-containing protein n=2 Tax=Streptomyces sp. 1222.5 TaxID=1881026 RepID=UPI003D73EC62